MIIIASNTQICVLPSPEWNDSRTPQSNVDIKRYKNGAYAAYINPKDLMELSFSFVLTNEKAREYQEFYENNAGKKLTLIYKDNEYEGIITTDPASLNYEGRSADECYGERVDLAIDFLGALVA